MCGTLEHRHHLDGSHGVDSSLFQRCQRRLIHILCKLGVHLQPRKLFNRSIERLTFGGGQAGLLLRNLFLDGCDLYIKLDDGGILRVKISQEGTALGFECGELSFKLVDDAEDVFSRPLRRH